MDNLTHGLLGYGVYALLKKPDMEKQKKFYALAGIIGGELPDIDSFIFHDDEAYLRIHRGITHSALLSPFMAAIAVGIVFILARKHRKDISWKRMYLLAFLGLLTHLGTDWMNTWGTGLLEPVVHSRYSLGFLPIIDPFLIIFFLIGFILRKKHGTHKAFQIVWSVILIYVASQGIQNLWIKQQVSSQYDQTVVSAGFIPTQFTVIGKNGESLEIYPKSIWSVGKKTFIHSTSNPKVVKKVLADSYAKTITWWSPLYAITLDRGGKYATVFDPRFYRNGRSFINAKIEIAGEEEN